MWLILLWLKNANLFSPTKPSLIRVFILVECVFIEIEHIRWMDVDAILPCTCALIGMALAIGTLYVTAKNNNTAIVKASTRELSYLILAGIILAYM